MEWEHFESQRALDARNAEYVPPEFRNEGRFALDEPPEFGLPVSKAQRDAFPPRAVIHAIDEAAILAHRRAPEHAEAARERAGYGGLGKDPHIPDQRWMLTDNDPLD